MNWIKTGAILALGGAVAGAAAAQPKQTVTGPVATYWMSAATTSGFGAGMMGAGGGRPSMGAMMNAMRGGGGASRSLLLQLGSSKKPAGEPAAEHLPPPALRAGASLPLLTPTVQPARDEPRDPNELPREFQKPKGKMLIFWGCGERARPGQPMVIDFAQAAAGKLPAGYQAAMRGFNVAAQQPPGPGRNATYGEWPNARTRTQVPGEGSLVGQHTVRGNYSPEIKFALAGSQDFLAPLALTRNEVGPSGAGQLGWSLVPNAQAYLATAVGAGGEDTVVLWTSSEVQASAFALPEYLTNADISRLVASRALMGPQTSTCAIPQEVVKAAPQAMVQMAAYGNETNISYPPRPQDPKVPWNIEWTVKVRYRSQTMSMLGMDMGEMGGPSAQPDRSEGPPGVPGVGGAILRGLGKGRIPGF